MNLPVELYDHPIVREVIQDAYRRIESWAVTQHEACLEAKKLLTGGWDGVCLMEIVAEPLLELQGITADDVDYFELMVVERNRQVNETNRGALYEEWDADRAESRRLEAT